MEVRKIARGISFKNGHVADFEFTLARNDREWDYGNGTRVELIDRNAGYMSRETFDTRYDTSLMADGSNFDEWIDMYIEHRFAGLMA